MAPKTSNGRPPIPNPYGVDYSPTDRATCKVCLGRIGEGAIRFLRKVWSPWHDGFDVQKIHLRCSSNYEPTLADLKGWQALRWDDVLKVAAKFGGRVKENHSLVQEYKRRSEGVWAFVDMLKDLPKKQLLAILDANEIFYNEKKISTLEAAQIIADGALFGLLPRCPLCSTRALLQEGPEIRCRGYMPNSAMRCSFRFGLADLVNPEKKPDNSVTGVQESDLTRTELFTLPPEAQRVPVLRQWRPPKDIPGALKLGNPIGQPPKKGQVKYDSEGEDDKEIPKRKELTGLKFACIGTTHPPRPALAKLIVSHGGVFSEGLESDTDILLVSDDSWAIAKDSQRYRDAQLAGVAIMRCSFVTALVSRKSVKPKLSFADVKKALRKTEDFAQVSESLPKRKFAAYYLVEGELMRPFPRVAEALQKLEAAQALSTAKASVMRPTIKAGSALLRVDPLFSRKGGKIYVDKFRNAYNVSTQFTDISTGVNKYYNLQLIQTNSTYHLFTRWGRLGADDKVTNDYRQYSHGSSLKSAISAFESKFFGLTGFSFADRFDTPQQPGRYAVVELEGYAHDEPEQGAQKPGERETKVKTEVAHAEAGKRVKEDTSDGERKKKKTKTEEGASNIKVETESTLAPAVQQFIKLIFDRDMAARALTEQHLNLQRMPIESISKRQLSEGYAVLQELQALLQESGEQRATQRVAVKLADATNRFYNKIPHVFARNAVPPVIDSLAKLRTKVEVMEQLLDVSVANSLLDGAMKNAKDKHPVDAQYEQLKCQLEPVERASEEWKLVETMLQRTHAPTHNTWTLVLEQLFKCERKNEKERFNKSVDNRMLLWHGSRLTNWASILSQGLKVAPPEAPSSGFMFDKGVYFADLASKSSQYCFATSKNPEGILLLCEVGLGKPYVRLEADSEAAKRCEEKGCHSLWAVGKSAPDAKDDITVDSAIDDSKVKARTGRCSSNKKAVDEAKKDASAGADTALLYNEYVVYNPNQIFMRYVLRVKFEFASFDLDDEL
ncbi:poly(ADP-ribose) polymerase catalytic domain-containing protein [Besnoitia besnoiti]|uniref:Poly [ADP-ribose] polymerase n=1 Tax=Besnoitia besnoiti TaxID=94643 RepID=A0A2A9MJA3_BESBE|nr:poly(ADP-ribose) polymerase catalytic domain-containing protein [Besnoitia besnoiti]PFH35733.1 poly(ADP-ribose) polymerase catalytic domain-containing protein [Besnoitia besnoiti]